MTATQAMFSDAFINTALILGFLLLVAAWWVGRAPSIKAVDRMVEQINAEENQKHAGQENTGE